MAFRVKKDNLERVFTDDTKKDALMNDGWKEVQLDYNSMTVEQLKALADEEQITYDSNIKKADLINLITAAK